MPRAPLSVRAHEIERIAAGCFHLSRRDSDDGTQQFAQYVQANEPGTKMYVAWQQKDDPTRFVHFFIFESEAAQLAHSQSKAVKRFESTYRPELAGGDVVFTGYLPVATNQG